MSTRTLRGIGASPGISIGPAHHYMGHKLIISRRENANPQVEKERLEAALLQGKQEIHELALQAQGSVGAREAEIFEAHEMFLSDPDLLEHVHEMIEQQINADYSWQEATKQYAAQMRAIEDPYLSARATDLEDVAQRILRILQGEQEQKPHITEPVILIAPDLTPSETVTFDSQKIRAFCIAEGGPTSHVAILAKALGIPAVTGLGQAIDQLREGAQVIVDGTAGEIFLDPDTATLTDYEQRAQTLARTNKDAFASAQQPARTADDHLIEVGANVGAPEQVEEALRQGADSIGLLRTEFLFLERDSAPSEQEQYTIYRDIFQAMQQRPVVIRTFDIGGDKPAPYLEMAKEMNPFLGIRGARLALKHPPLFQSQLCALLRAGEGHRLRIMFPMVSTREEIKALQEQVKQAQATLEARKASYAREVEIGIMIEVPSAALMSDVLAPLVDFFSIGTNDLTQYVLASDRTNATVAYLADALHPAVLRLIRMVSDAAHAHGKWVGLCGELAGNPLATPVLLGLGLDEFSMTPGTIPLVKQRLRHYSTTQARDIALHALDLHDANEVHAYLASL
ncbi:phosphoenolpyruvate--protein phosphotransferase [Ktedonospora formicarum]|uniref:Phosphoenolpyruvate-protein phosphotransferase n=1 Tax=Ktedonospora formicarum TaxID=2778364 RepID=A0A8J3HRU5_9CHLR|nr:phosphoenolpyruvate--protein phosphotransferase [Ktedonospora formicarum]GHO42752.1 phosphoenolpyruvate-protein phosphotransferase [Ktedonospora formicarum]